MMEFYQSYSTIDIWREFDSKSGNTIYEFFYNGKTYTDPDPKNIVEKAKAALNKEREDRLALTR